MANLHLLSDRNKKLKATPANLLDELSQQVKNGEVEIEDMIIVHISPAGDLTVINTPMMRYKALGMLTYASYVDAVTE